MKKNLIKGLLLLSAAITILACSEYDNGFTEKEIKFRSDFEHEIGVFDAQQDWNLAQRANVTVITSLSRPVKVYSQKGDSYHLVGDFNNVYGEQTLSVDVEKGTEYLFVTDDNHTLRAELNDTVSFDDIEEDKETRTVNTSSWYWSRNYVNTPVGITSDEKDTEKYFSEEANRIVMPWKNFYVQLVKRPSFYLDIAFSVYNNNSSSKYDQCHFYYPLYRDVLFENVDTSGLTSSQFSLSQFGEYDDYSIVKYGNAYYLGFKVFDAFHPLDEAKYSMMVFKITRAVTKEEANTQSWIIAAEDLGGSFDIDYNDVVFKVEHVSGRTTAKVTPLAAGGTLASYIYYEDPKDGQRNLGEAHKLLKAADQLSGDYQPINVGSSVSSSIGAPITINVSSNWSIALDDKYNYEGNNMGGFSIHVAPQGAQPGDVTGETVINAPKQGDAPYMLCVPFTYEKDGSTHVWQWPKELVRITNAYSNFTNWKGNHTLYQNWYQYPNDGYTVDTSGLEP